MSKQRIIDRSALMSGVKRTGWGEAGITPTNKTILDYRDTTIRTKTISAGRSLDSVRMYVSHDIYGTIRYLNDDSMAAWSGTNVNDREIITIDGTAGRASGLAVNGTCDYVDSYNDKWHHPTDNTPFVIYLPFVKIDDNSLEKIILKCNWAINRADTTDYARLTISTDTTNSARVKFNVLGVNNAAQRTTHTGYRNWQDGADDVAFKISLYHDNTGGQSVAYCKIVTDDSQSDLNLTGNCCIAPITYGYINIEEINENPTYGRTLLQKTRIEEGDDETTDRITYYLSRDDGANWQSVSGDGLVADGQAYSDMDLSGQGAGDKELIGKIAMRAPTIFTGFGLAWGGD